MPFKSKDSLLKSEFFSLMTSSTGEIDRIIFPNGAQVGLTHPDFRSNLDVYGSITSRKSGPDTIRGSLTKLLDGTPFLVGGNNASLVTGSGGEITISISPGGANTQVQFNDAGILGGDSNFVFNKTTNTLSVTAISGSHTKLADGTSLIAAGTNVTITTGSTGQITISAAGGSGSPGGANGLVQYNNAGSFGGGTNFHWDNSNQRLGIGTTSPDYTLDVAGNIGVNEYIYHNTDNDTYLLFQDNLVDLVAGGKSAIKLQTSANKIALNNNNEDLDVQIMADDGNVIVHTDAGTNRVGIGNTSP